MISNGVASPKLSENFCWAWIYFVRKPFSVKKIKCSGAMNMVLLPQFKNLKSSRMVVAHTLNSSTRETEAGGYL